MISFVRAVLLLIPVLATGHMQTSTTKLEDMDFKPRLPLLRLAILLLVFSFLTFGFITNAKSRLEFTPITDPGFLSESVFVGLLLLLFLGFMLSYLILQFRLSFTEEGIRRRTLLKPMVLSGRNTIHEFTRNTIHEFTRNNTKKTLLTTDVGVPTVMDD